MKSRHFLLFSLSAAMLMIMYSCKKDSSPNDLPKDPVPVILSEQQKAIVGSGNKFAFDIFGKTLKEAGSSQNIIISPFSLSTALSMAMNGANGSTQSAMLTVLGQSSSSPESINSSVKELVNSLLTVDKRIDISVANSVWTESKFTVKKPFSDILTNYYNAEEKSFSIDDPSAPGNINKWISDKTNGLIKKMVEKLDPYTAMLLINAIHFKGKWKYPFEVDNTHNQAFYLVDGTNAQVQMMSQTNTYGLYNGDGFTLAELPYGQGNYVMDVVMATGGNKPETIISLLTEANFASWTSKMTEMKVMLGLPKFKYGFGTEMKKILSDMGMGIAFSDMADFSNISDNSLTISTVKHNAFIETNEEGTEAAAATIIGIITTSMPPSITFDHPFIYLIREKTTGAILFMGLVANPLAG